MPQTSAWICHGPPEGCGDWGSQGWLNAGQCQDPPSVTQRARIPPTCQRHQAQLSRPSSSAFLVSSTQLFLVPECSEQTRCAKWGSPLALDSLLPARRFCSHAPLQGLPASSPFTLCQYPGSPCKPAAIFCFAWLYPCLSTLVPSGSPGLFKAMDTGKVVHWQKWYFI